MEASRVDQLQAEREEQGRSKEKESKETVSKTKW